MINLPGPLFLFAEPTGDNQYNQWFIDMPMTLKLAKRAMKGIPYTEIYQWSNIRQGWVKIHTRR